MKVEIISTFFEVKMKSLNVEKRNKIITNILIFSLVFLIVFGVSKVKVFDSALVPFGMGIVFSLLGLGINGYVLSVVYVSAYSLSGLTVFSVLESLNVGVVLAFLFFITKKKNFKPKKWLTFVCAMFALTVYICTHLGSAKENLALFVIVILSLLFLYSCMVFFGGLFSKIGIGKLCIDEKICGAVILVLFTYGMSLSYVGIVCLGLLFSTLIILLCTYISSGGTTIIISALLGASFSLSLMSPIYISLFVVLSVVSLAFKSNYRWLSSVAVVILYVLYLLIFSAGISIGEVLSVAIGSVLFCFLPKRLIDRYNGIFDNKYTITVKNVLGNAKNQIIRRAEELSKIFFEMESVYKGMVRGVLPSNKAIIMLKEEFINDVCVGCKNYQNCYLAINNFMGNSIDTIISIAYERGKVLLVDLPQYFSTNCVCVGEALNVVNRLVASYKDYANVITNIDSSRLLIANQLGGVARLLETLSKEVDVGLDFNNNFDEKIKEELAFKNITCLDVAVYQKDISFVFVNLIVSNVNLDKDVIQKIVSKTLKCPMQISEIVASDIPNACLIRMCPAPKFDVAYGYSSITKTGKVFCGDSKSLLKIGNGKYMLSICDGMGSGESASSISSLTISLIEKFYVAGFDNETIINSVNKLLSINEEENFSTIDLCIIDAYKNTYDFIKLGATVGFLKRHKGECEIIESSGLPIGVIEEIHPHITRKIVSPFDIVVMVSDGVTDSFEGKIDLCQFISHLDIINPRTLSRKILDEAISLNGGVAIDDMTVICARVFPNY